jgi:hypothetical protein
MESLKKQSILILWFLWQFYEMPKFLIGVWVNYFIFASNLFSIPSLLKTFFSPWRRYKWQYPRGFDIGEFFSTFVSNLISRILGAIMRIVLIIVGILFQIIVVISGLVFLLGWLLMPLIIVFGFLIILFF